MKRIGIDIGGTFTDCVYRDDAGAMHIHKLPSTPDDPARAGRDGALALCDKAGVTLADIDQFVHGTTVATNILLEHDGARVGLITTRGFRDILHIGRKNRPLNFSHRQQVPRQSSPLVPRRLRMTVRERVRAPDGAVEVPLVEADVHDAIAALRAEGDVEAIAICCLFSFLNPAHERRIAEIVRAEWPGAYVCASHEVVPLYREYERFSTTALNAAVGPRTARYIGRFAEALAADGLRSGLQLMTSAGGVIDAGEAAARPVSLLLSGPVGALVAGIEAGRATGNASVITLDVGGTSADIGVAPGGELRMRHLLDTSIADYDAMVPMADISTIGAGGGSIARVDAGGMFQVGPQSAGAVPGPACYGHGGTHATVTDALVALGWYRPAALRASGLAIDAGAARAAIRAGVAEPLGLDIAEAAAGIHRIATHNMTEAIRVASVARGFDPRDFSLVAYGGAGAAFAAFVARELSIGRVVVPPSAGVGAAGGLLVTDLRYERQATLWADLAELQPERVEAAYGALADEVRAKLASEGFEGDAAQLRWLADCRYAGQGYELRVDAPPPPVGDGWARRVAAAFHAEHERAYGRRFEDKAVRVVNIAVAGTGRIAPPPAAPWPARGDRAPVAETAPAGFPGPDGLVTADTRFHRREDLGAGAVVEGPAVIEQNDTTTVLPPGMRLEVGREGHLVIDTGVSEP